MISRPCQSKASPTDYRGGTTVDVSIERLADNHWADVYRYAYRWTGNAADAEDLVQQVFLLAQRHLDQLRDPSRATSWLMTIVRNTYWKQSRRQRPQPASAMDLRIDWFPDSRSNETNTETDTIQAALNQLDDSHRQILLMYYFEDLSYRQIAEKTEVKLGTVMSRLSRAKSRLKEILAAQAPDGEKKP